MDQFIITNTDANIDLASGDTLLVVKGVTLYRANADETVGTFGEAVTVRIEGTVASTRVNAVGLFDLDGGAANHTLIIGTEGSALVHRDYVSVLVQGTGNLVQNFGFVSGGGGVWGQGWSGGRIENDGIIAAGRFAGVKLLDSVGPSTILNDGLITGAGGVQLQNATATIVNAEGGEIRSNSAAVAAVDATLGGTAGFTLRNAGEIVGLGNAVTGSAGADRVVNTGVIDGDVLLGAGNDLFNGRRGTLDGILRGGDGNDTLLAGAGDDTIYGDFGADRLEGNGGDDLLYGGGSRDVFVFNRTGGDDVIADFQNGADLLDLVVYRFASFAAVSALATNVAGGLLLDLPGADATVFVAGLTRAGFDATDVVL